MRFSEIQPQAIQEGVYDPHIFKAVFNIGGPGSGKTTISQRLFGHSGLRPVDIDRFFTMSMIRNPSSGNFTQERYWGAGAKGDALIRKTVALRLGLLIDGTGRNLNWLLETKHTLEGLGYDTMALFVQVDINTAKDRNEQRRRRVPDEFLERAHQQVNSNLPVLSQEFGRNLLIYDNSGPIEPNYLAPYTKKVNRFLNQPPTKPQAQAWIASELERQRQPENPADNKEPA